MRSEPPSQSLVWGVLPARFQSELTLHKSEICRLSGLLEEYGPAGANYTGEGEEHKIIEELTGFLVQAVAQEALDRQFYNGSGRRAGRPRDAVTPYLALELLFGVPALPRLGRPAVGSDHSRIISAIGLQMARQYSP